MADDVKLGALLVSGPYGVGKDTLLNELFRVHGHVLHRVRTLTTRPSSSTSDPTYTTVSPEELARLTGHGRWIVNEQFSGAVQYATSVDEIEHQIAQGKICIHSIFAGPHGAGRMRELLGKRLFAVGLLATTGGVDDQIDVLQRRLAGRTRDDEDALKARLNHQVDPIRYVLDNPSLSTPNGRLPVFDSIFINDDLGAAVTKFLHLFEDAFRLPQGSSK